MQDAARWQLDSLIARGPGRVEVLSAGSEPAEQVNPAVIEAMLEKGIDLRGERPKLLSDSAVRRADVVITMGCGDACPIYPGKTYEDWDVDDTSGKDVAGVRPIRDEIERRVERLLVSCSRSSSSRLWQAAAGCRSARRGEGEDA